MRLPGDAALIFVSGAPAIYGTKIRYYLDADFSQRAKIPPPRFSDRIEHAEDFSGSPDARNSKERPESAVTAATAATAQSPNEPRDSEKSIAGAVRIERATAIDGDEKTMSERLL
jgi:type IV secretory pathway TraG/TraD family ATPase VirD4